MTSVVEKPEPAALPRLAVQPRDSEDVEAFMEEETIADRDTRNQAADGSPTSTEYRGTYETDLDMMIRQHTTEDYAKKSFTCQRSGADSQVWPGQEHWKMKAKAERINRSRCGCLARMSKRNRVILQVSIILLIVGIAVSVGFGISKPLGAPIPNPLRDNTQW